MNSLRNVRKFIKIFLLICAAASFFCIPASAATKTSVKALKVGSTYTISNASKVTSSKKSVAAAKKKSSTKYKVTAKKKGVSTLKVYNKKGKLTQKIYLLAYNGKTFSYSTSTVNLAKGGAKTVKASTNQSGVTVKYKSSDSSIATVSSKGKITAKKAGQTTIKAMFYYKGTKVKTVNKKVNVYSSSYDTSALSLTAGKTKTVAASISSNASVKYSSSDTSVATVSSSGKITSKKKGTATITAKIYIGSTCVKTYTKKVTVTAASSSSSTSSASSGSGSTSGSSGSSGSSSSGSSGSGSSSSGSSASSGSSSSSSSSGSSSSASTFKYHASPSSVTVAGGSGGSIGVYCEKASDSVTFKSSNDCAELGLITTGTCVDDYNDSVTAYYTRVGYTGRKIGTCNVEVYINGSLFKTIPITVTSNDDNYYVYQDWKADIKSKIWYSGMTDLQKIVSFGDYVCDTCYYKTSGSKYSLSGSGYGDCWSMAALFVDLAQDLGYNAETIRPYYDLGKTNYSPNHYFARIYNINGSSYYDIDMIGDLDQIAVYGSDGKLVTVTYDKKW